MTEETTHPTEKMESEQRGFFRELLRELGEVWKTLVFALLRIGPAFRNWQRKIRRFQIDYVVIPVGGPLPERSGPPRSFLQRQLPLPAAPFSMESLNKRLAKIADADNVKGVVFIFQGFSAGLATLTNFRRAVERLREAGKRTVVFTPYLDLAHYYAATSADTIVVPPSASFDVLGLRSEAVFFKDALDRIGVKADVIQISPYKTAYDGFVRSDASAEQKEQLNWILDDTYHIVTEAMASGRQIELDSLLDLIDQAPFMADKALQSGLVDHVGYEDSLPYLLVNNKKDRREVKEDSSKVEQSSSTEDKEVSKKRAKIVTWNRARTAMLEKARRPVRDYIGVLSLEGIISMGPSRRPPVNLPIPIPMMNGETAGEQTISKLIRMAERDSRMAALVLQIDSPGGLSIASDLIWRQVARLAETKPVLAFVGNVAASGGYYVSLGAHHIMGAATSITGSIGVIAAHFSTGGLYEKLSVGRVVLHRGKNVNMLSDAEPLTEEQREILWQNVVKTYEQFTEHVANSRKLTSDELDKVCNGRVWTGRQAIEHKLFDSHGDFIDALSAAADLAGLEIDDDHQVRSWNLHVKKDGYLPPKPSETLESLLQLDILDRLLSLQEKTLALMPFEIRFK